MNKQVTALGLILMACTAGCGGSATSEGENHGDLLQSPQGLVLTEEEHSIGWKQSECTLCHHLENIHLVNRTGTAMNMEAIYEQAISNGIAGCRVCHGTNGL